MNRNNNCDGAHCDGSEEVRVLPLGGGANVILCRGCYRHEASYRRAMQVHYGGNWTIPAWQELEVYGQEVAS